MSDGVDFDEELLEQIERLYRTTSMAGRRRWIRDALDLANGESVLSIGPGPGFESRGLAEAVGETGRVHGVDTSDPMLAAARERCADQPWATFEHGDAADLPVADATFDVATAVQVYEYVPNLESAIGELHRVLRPGGRAAVFDSDWTTMTYHAADEERSERILRAFDAHCPHPRIARRLRPLLEGAGFAVTEQDAWVHFETGMTEDATGTAFVGAIREFVTQEGGIDEGVADGWVEDLRARDEAGEYFFSFNQYLFTVEKPPDT